MLKNFIFLFLLSCQIVNGQYASIFGKITTEWNVILRGYCDASFTTNIFTSKDTNINNLTYKILELKSEFDKTKFEYLREDTSSGKVWHYNKSAQTEILLMNLDLNTGDSFNINTISKPFMLVVDSVYLKGGIKHIRFNGKNNQICDAPARAFEFIEGTGSNGGIIFSSEEFMMVYSYLLCHHKDGFKVYGNSDFDNRCNIKIIANQDLSNSIHAELFPNPTASNFEVRLNTILSKNYRLNILNSIGQLLQSVEIKNLDSVISFENQISGFYYYALYNDKSIIQSGKIIKL